MKLTLLLVLLGCVTTEGTLSTRCPAVRFSEVMTASQNYDVIDGDWFELENVGDAPIDLAGLLLLRRGQPSAYAVPEGTTVGAGGFQVFLALTYVDTGSAEPTTGFDLNADSDALQIQTHGDRGGEVCDEVDVPASHDDFSWAFDPASGRWCFAAEPTPGGTNAPCLCDVSDAC